MPSKRRARSAATSSTRSLRRRSSAISRRESSCTFAAMAEKGSPKGKKGSANGAGDPKSAAAIEGEAAKAKDPEKAPENPPDEGEEKKPPSLSPWPSDHKSGPPATAASAPPKGDSIKKAPWG